MAASRDAIVTSPLRGEVAAKRRVRGSELRLNTPVLPTPEPLTPALSPQGRGGISSVGNAW